MTLTVTLPQTGDPFGPGFQVVVSTDLIGPLPPDSFWLIQLDAVPEETNLGAMTLRLPSHSIGPVWLNRSDEFTNPIWARPEWVTGHAATLRIRLFEDDTTVIEDTSVSVVLDRETGQVYEITQFIKDWVPAITTGLTESEHNAVLQTNVGVIAMAGINPLDMIGDLAAAFASSPPLAFGSLSATYVLSGDGEMPDIGDLLHTKLAIYFVATTIPAGLGHRHGQSEEYPSRLVQWRTVHTVDDLEVVTEVLDFITHGELWKWRQAKPLRIEYSILPGVVLAARWWQFP